MAGTDGFSFPTLFSFLPLFAFGGRKRLRGWAEEGGGRNDYLARWVIPIPWHSHSRRLRTKERAPIPSSSPPLLPWVLPKASESGRRGKASSLMVICAAASFLFSYSPLPPMSPVMMITSNLLPSPSSSPPFFPYPASFYISLLLWMLVQRRRRGGKEMGERGWRGRRSIYEMSISRFGGGGGQGQGKAPERRFTSVPSYLTTPSQKNPST